MGYLDPRHYTARLRHSQRARYRVPRQVCERLTRRRNVGRAREISGWENPTDPFDFMSAASKSIDQGFSKQETRLDSESELSNV